MHPAASKHARKQLRASNTHLLIIHTNGYVFCLRDALGTTRRDDIFRLANAVPAHVRSTFPALRVQCCAQYLRLSCYDSNGRAREAPRNNLPCRVLVRDRR